MNRGPASVGVPAQSPVPAPAAVSPQDNKAKLKKDLESVKHHITIFNELLTGIPPGKGTDDDNKLMAVKIYHN